MKTYLNFVAIFPINFRKKLLILVPLLGLSGVLEVASVAALIPLISLVMDKSKIESINSFLEFNFSYEDMLLAFSISIIVLFILKGLFSLFVYKYTYRFVATAKSYIQMVLFSSYLNKKISFFMNSNSSEYIRNIMTECNVVESRFIMPVVVLISESIPIIFLFSFVIYLNPTGILFSGLLFIITGLLITKLTSSLLQKYATEQMKSDGEMIKSAQQAFSSIREIIIYSKQSEFKTEFNNHSINSANYIAKGLFINTLPKYLLEIVAILGMFIIGGIVFYTGNSTNEIFIQMGVFLASLVKILPSVNKIVAHIQALSYSKPSLDNYLKTLNGHNDVTSNMTNEKNNELEEFKSLTFSNVSFSYNGISIFKDFNLCIDKGKSIGIVGKTGSGKSTLLNLIIGLLEPDSGDIYVNDYKLTSVVDSYRNKIGYVPQETYLLDDTIFNNICFFRNYRVSQDAIEQARVKVYKLLKEMDLLELVDNLPHGIDTYVGEQGGRLSGGQKQRIGIARALFSDPEIIIFDEATSALDKLTEEKIISYITKYHHKKTIIMIAHRESTLSKCDYILDLNVL